MKHLRIVVAVAFALAMLPAPWTMGTKAHAAHGFHFSNHLHAGHHHGAYGAYYSPFYSGGIVAVPPYAPTADMTYTPAPTVVYVPLPPQALTCHRSRQTVTVPAEAGGTRQITVTRC